MSNIAIAEVRTMATSATKSGMFGIKNQEQAFTLMMISQAEGIHPIQALQMYSVINGMPSLKSTEVQARFQKAGGKIQWIETTNEKAVCKLTHEQGGTYESEFTMDMAKQMKLADKDNWKKMPKQMLMARAVSMGVRAVYPACLNNMYAVEEAQDIEPTQDEEIQEVEIEEIPIDELKKTLARKLMKHGVVEADIKAFAAKYKLNEDTELLGKLVEDETLLIAKINEFEGAE